MAFRVSRSVSILQGFGTFKFKLIHPKKSFMKSKLMSLIMLIAIFIAAASFTFFQQEPKPWPVPDEYNKMTNPVKTNATSLSAGKALWVKHCQSCHGKTGKGDGTKSAELKTHPGDFTQASTQGETDGALFYKTSKGRDDMPSFKKKIPDEEDIWNVINYVRTFKK
jgi:mono/diheme cytochrome c family protein